MEWPLFLPASTLIAMSLSIGIVGLPNVGKSTLFNALTKKSVPATNYPFCTIDPSVGVVAVPDERLAKLTELSHSAKTIPAAIEFVDIAGLVKGASEGEGLGNQFLSHIREVDAIAEVVRIFDDDNIIHVAGKVDPIFDIETINLELILADMQTVGKRLAGLSRDVKRGDTAALVEEKLLQKVREALQSERLASSVVLTDEESVMLKGLHLLTSKPVLYVLNKKAGAKNLDELADGRYEKLFDFFKQIGAHFVIVDAGIEDELKELNSEEKTTFRQEYKVKDDGINTLIQESYRLLSLITFFTTGEDETRAWTIQKGSSAPEAGAAIHSDFREKFIRAEVIAYSDLVATGSLANARDKGLLRTEGKDYIVKDGDVIEFKI